MKKLITILTAVLIASAGMFAQAPQTKGLNSKYIAQNYYKGVVKILLVDSAMEKSKGPGKGYVGRGTGFFVTEDGIIFTNRHVVEYCVTGYIDYDYKDEQGRTVQGYDAYSDDIISSPNFIKAYRTGYTTPVVQVYYGQGQNDYTLYIAKVLTIGTGSFDGAMLKIVSDINGNPVSKTFFPLPIGNSDAAVQGEDLCVYGYPAQYDGDFETMKKDMSTLTFGKLSGYDYVFNKDYGYIKTDASINGGNSGGPVFNESNKVIGIATAVGNKTGIGLVGGVNGMYYVAAPKSDVLQDLIKKGLTIPKNAGSISTITGERKPIKSISQINGNSNNNTSNNNTSNNNNNNSNNNSSSDAYTKSKVYCTDDINEDTKKIGDEVDAFTINSNGGWVWVVVTNSPNTLETEELIMDVYKKDANGEYKEFVETKRYTIKSSLNTTYFKYSFYKEGNYKLSVYNKNEKWINTAYVKISVKGGSSSSSGGSGDYSKSKVYFTNDVSDDGVIGKEGSSYIINKSTGSYIYCVVTNYPGTFNTDEIIVDIYKKKGSEYKFVETKRYTIKSSLNTTYFKYSFYEKGDYKFAVYNKDSKWINTGYVTISYK